VNPSKNGANASTEQARTFEGETFGERLFRLRGQNTLSQRELAEDCDGVSYAYISRLEAGARTASVRAIRELARVLGVTEAYLEFGHEQNSELGALLRRVDELQAALNRERARADELAELVGEYRLQLDRYEQGGK
jgi:transcriptional regulator with XRE-family HTH domain